MRFTQTVCAIGCVPGLTGTSLAADAVAAPGAGEITARISSKRLNYTRRPIEAYGKLGLGADRTPILSKGNPVRIPNLRLPRALNPVPGKWA